MTTIRRTGDGAALRGSLRSHLRMRLKKKEYPPRPEAPAQRASKGDAIRRERWLRSAWKPAGTAAALLAATLLATPAGAVDPSEMLDDPALEKRAQEIGRELRCLVCQNESIEDSNAELAGDLRVLVRDRLKDGDSDREVVDYVVSRYGDYVLLTPPFKAETLLLWAGPGALLLIGLTGLALFYRRGAGEADGPPPLNDRERARLARLLEDPDS